MLNVSVNGKEAKAIEFKGNAEGTINGQDFSWDLIEQKEGSFHIIHNHKSYTAEIVERNLEEKSFIIKINGNNYPLTVKDKFDSLLKQLGMDNLSSKKVNEIKAPMPGLVLSINVSEGDEVKKGDTILILEAMKMENVIKSPTDGTISKINIKTGVSVEKNALLINFG